MPFSRPTVFSPSIHPADPDTPWLAHYPASISPQLDIPETPLYHLLQQAAQTYGEAPCVHFLGREWNYQHLQTEAAQIAAGLQCHDIAPGDRVMLLLPNCPLFISAYFGILRAGATVVNANPLSGTEELAAQLKDAGCKAVITVNLSLCLDKLRAALPESPVEHVFIGDFPAMLPPLKGHLMRLFKRSHLSTPPQTDARCKPFAALLEHGHLPKDISINPAQDIAVLQYTGGTTGIPKGAALTHQNLWANTLQCQQWCASLLTPGQEVMLGVLPLFHVFAMTVVMNLGLHLGMKLVLLPRLDMKQLLRTIQQQRPTTLPGVPSLYHALTQQAGRYNLSSIRCCISGGAGLPLEIKQAFETRTGCTLIEGYGLTEASPVCAANPLQGTNKAGSIGMPLPATRLDIRDPENPSRRLPQGEIGELVVSGPQVMQGYWQKLEETAESFILEEIGTHHRLWLRTGDLAYQDEQGYFYIVDRLKEIIITRGYNVYPRQLEEILYQHPAISEAAVVGEADTERGQKVVAHLVLKPGHSATPEQLQQFLKNRVAQYALPSHFYLHDSLPKSMVGKILKRQLQPSRH